MVSVFEVIVNGYEEIILNDGVSICELQSPEISEDLKDETEDENEGDDDDDNDDLVSIEILEEITEKETFVELTYDDLSSDGISDEEKINADEYGVTEVADMSDKLDSVHLLQTVSVSVTILKL
ncbi:unnamed protein product [[Candida] boidinii]|nr:unnamed protein product [[Candida] boidinii]